MRVLAASTVVGLLAGHAVAWKHGDAAELKQQLSQNDYTLVAFVASESGLGDALLPEWEAVQGDAALQSVDCSASRDLCADMDVASLPAIRLYRREKPMIRYRGPRKASRISAFLRRAQRPVVTQLTESTAAEFASADSVAFIAHLRGDDAADTSLAGRFSALAAAHRDRYSFGVVRGGPAGPSTLRCRNNDDGTEHTEAALDGVGALEAFVAACAEPLVPELSRRTELKYMQAAKSLVYYFSADAVGREAFAGAMRPLAKRYGAYLQLVTVDSAEYPGMARALGVASATGLVVENALTGQAFPYRGGEPTTPEAVERFLAAVSEGRAEAWDAKAVESDGGESDGGESDDGEASHDEL